MSELRFETKKIRVADLGKKSWQELYESVYKKRENFRINLIFVRISIGFSDKSWYADYQSKKYSSVITAGNEEE